MVDRTPKRWAVQAKWVLPVASPPLKHGIVTVHGETIESVGVRVPDAPVCDLGNVIVAPALINTHTHLEFSQLADPLTIASRSFAAWLEGVVNYRRAASASAQDTVRSGVDPAIAQGAKELATHGTCCVGDIATISDYRAPSSLDGIVFHELLCLRADRAAEAWHGLLQRMSFRCTSPSWRLGVSPHSPYTLRQDLFVRAVQHAVHAGLPVAMHLAESREEMQVLSDHQGPLRYLFEAWGVWDPTGFATGTRPMDYLRQLQHAPRTLVVHANYLDEREVEFLAVHRDTMSVVHCPRTHAYFSHNRNPLREMMAAGVRVVIGTDSRASNPDLSLFEELKYLARTHRDLGADALLAMGTRDAADSLGMHRLGALTQGGLANLIVVDPGTCADADPYWALLGPDSVIRQAYWRGQLVSQAPPVSS